MRDVLRRLQQWNERGSKAALCTLVEARGTSPRPVGAWMAVCESGEVVGSITGGCVENDAIERARAVLARGVPETATYGIADDLGVEVGLTCGGSVDALIEPFADGPVWRRLAELLDGDQAGALAVVVEPEALRGRRLLVAAGDEVVGSIDPAIDAEVVSEARRRMEAATAGTIETGGARVFVQGFVRPQRLIIVGASHPAVALTRLAATLGFRITVIDPRSALLESDRLPEADERVCAWPDDALAKMELGADCYVVALAHDPKFDTPAIAHSLRAGVAYIGAIGSRKTHERRKQRLREMGFSDADLSRVRSPVGLDLGGRSPEEIALAVLAEMVAVRYGRDAEPLSNKAAPIHGGE